MDGSPAQDSGPAILAVGSVGPTLEVHRSEHETYELSGVLTHS
jgi:hypothetical protein